MLHQEVHHPLVFHDPIVDREKHDLVDGVHLGQMRRRVSADTDGSDRVTREWGQCCRACCRARRGAGGRGAGRRGRWRGGGNRGRRRGGIDGGAGAHGEGHRDQKKVRATR